MQGLGYKEFFDYFDGEMSLEETVDKVKRDTRRFAKRQLTWFRREKEVVWLNKKEYEDYPVILAVRKGYESGVWEKLKHYGLKIDKMISFGSISYYRYLSRERNL